MSDTDHRRVDLTRLRKARFLVRNERGGVLELGEGDDYAFTPVELLLAAVAGCTGIDIDYLTAKRAEADELVLRMDAEKVRDEHGNHLTGLVLHLSATFPEGEAGDAAREVLPSAVRRSHDRLCTVSRTVELESPVEVVLGLPEGHTSL